MAARQSKAGTGTEVRLLLHLEQDASNDTSSKKKKGLPGCIGGRLHTRIQLRKRRMQTGPRSHPSPFPRLQMSSPGKEHTGNCFDFDFAPDPLI